MLRTRLFIIMGLLLLVVAGYYGFQFYKKHVASIALREKQEIALQKRQVLYTKHMLSRGTRLNAKILTWKTLPADKVKPEYFVRFSLQEKKDLNNAIVLRYVAANKPVPRDALLSFAGTPFARMVEPGMRAVVVPLSGLQLVNAGEYIDILLTYTPPGSEGGGSQVVSQVLFQKVLVLHINRPSTKAKGAFGVEGLKQDKSRSSAVLELTPKQVQQIVVALRMGSLSVSLPPYPPSAQPLQREGPVESRDLMEVNPIEIIRGRGGGS